jgi:transcription-repair coupling factor (superfamily II helicase)
LPVPASLVPDCATDLVADTPVTRPARRLIAAAVEGLDALHLARTLAPAAGQLLHVARDGGRAALLAELASFFAPELEVVVLPAWDCLPYDRVSPNPDILARRLDALARLSRDGPRPPLVITTVNAFLQQLPPPELLRAGLFRAAAGERIDRERLLACLARNGYRRSGTVVESGEYAIRGGIIDIFPSGSGQPLRLDLFGDTLEAVRAFDPLTQRSLGKTAGIELGPVSEVLLDEAAVERFRAGYLKRFGAVTGDPLLESISAGRPFPGMEHWLPLFHERLVDLFAYLEPGCAVSFDPLAEEAIEAREATIGEHYAARREPPAAARAMGGAVPAARRGRTLSERARA